MRLERRPGHTRPLRGLGRARRGRARARDARSCRRRCCWSSGSAGSASARPCSSARGRTLGGRYFLDELPRGRYSFTDVRAVLEDPFGLERVDAAAAGRRDAARLPAAGRARGRLHAGDRGAPGPAGCAVAAGRLRPAQRARVPAGRVAAQGALAHDRPARRADGQGLRRRGARRGRRDPGRRGGAGASAPPPSSSFDAQVRAAGSILHAHVRAGPARRCWSSTAPGGPFRRCTRPAASGGRRSSCSPRSSRTAPSRVGEPRSPTRLRPAARALELVVVTAALTRDAGRPPRPARALAPRASRSSTSTRGSFAEPPRTADRAAAAAAPGGRDPARRRPQRRRSRRGPRFRRREGAAYG